MFLYCYFFIDVDDGMMLVLLLLIFITFIYFDTAVRAAVTVMVRIDIKQFMLCHRRVIYRSRNSISYFPSVFSIAP